MNQITKEKLKLLIFERIKRVQAQRTPKDSKYPISLKITVYPTLVSSLSSFHPSYLENYNEILRGDPSNLAKEINIYGDYAKNQAKGLKTLRLKINRADWPEEWNFPVSEMDRRLFLQNFRLNNLDMITPFDEGGEEYSKIFPPEPDTPIEIVFDEEESSSSSEEETPKTNEEKIIEVLEALDYLATESREEGELDISASISEAYRTLLSDAIQNKKR